jgi:anti-sigma-K factor RskA
MNVQEYIASGILELYAMGALSGAEMREVEAMLEKYPEIREEFERIQASLEAYAMKHSVQTSADLKKNVMNAINGREKKIIPLYSRLAVAASLAALLVSLIVNYTLYSKLEKSDAQVAQMIDDQNKLKSQYDEQLARYDQVEKDLNLLKHPGMIAVELSPTETGPKDAKAMVYTSRKTSEVFLELVNMPVPPSGMQYQLWGMVDGKPVDAGLITMEPDSSIHAMKTVPGANAYAISLETAGGNTSPKGAIVVMGGVSP